MVYGHGNFPYIWPTLYILLCKKFLPICLVNFISLSLVVMTSLLFKNSKLKNIVALLIAAGCCKWQELYIAFQHTCVKTPAWDPEGISRVMI